RELRMAGVRASALAPGAFVSAAKHAEFQALLGAYEEFLASSRRGDLATVYEEATKHVDWCPIQPRDCWTCMPDVGWAPLQRALLEAMPGDRIVPRAIDLPAATAPRRLKARVERVPPAPEATLAFLMRPENASGGNAIKMFHAGGCEAEIEEVFRRI